MNRDMAKGARFGFYTMLFGMGAVFWITAKLGYFSMSEDVYGRAVDYPAVWWALAMLLPSSTYLMALFINGRRWWTAPTRITIDVLMMFYFSMFVAYALPASGGDLMVVASVVLMIKSGVMAFFDVCDMKRVWGPRNG